MDQHIMQPRRMLSKSAITMLDETLPHPVFVTPMGSHGLVHPAAEVAAARGAARSGGLLCVSSASTASMEDIGAGSAGRKWFQMYLIVDAGLSTGSCRRSTAVAKGLNMGSEEEAALRRVEAWLTT